MKVIFSLLLAVLAVASARYHKGHSKRQEIDMQSMFSCQLGMAACFSDLEEKYGDLTPPQQLKAFQDAGIEKICEEIYPAKACVVHELHEPDCEDLPEEYRETVLLAAGIADYVCSGDTMTKIDEHWDCFFNPTLHAKLMTSCQQHAMEMGRTCDPGPALDCLKEVVESTCHGGSGTLARTIGAKALVPQTICPKGPFTVASTFMNLLRRK